MHVVVCIKQILDPELPPRQFRVNAERTDAERGNASLVIGPFDLNALEVAMQLKEKAQARVSVVTLGGPEAKEALRRALAMGCDEAFLIERGEGPLDALATARVLSAGIQQLGEVDLVLCGRQSGDWDQGMVGPLLGEMLAIPALPFVRQVELNPDGHALMQKEVDGGWAEFEVQLPALATITNSEDNVPRLPKVKDIMMAGRKPMTHWTIAELGVSTDQLQARVAVQKLAIPQAKGSCEILEGETGEEKAQRLAERLNALKLLPLAHGQ